MVDLPKERAIIGCRLKAIRLKRYKHMSIHKLSKVTGLTLKTIRNIECGYKRAYNIDSLILYKNALKQVK